jgi:hypothetical protein
MMRRDGEMMLDRTARVALRLRAGWLALGTGLLLAACARPGLREAEVAPQQVPGGSGAAPRSVSLAGTWQLDLRATGRSVDARGMPMEGSRPGFGGRPGGGGGYGGRPGGYPQGESGGRAGRDSALARDSLARDSVRAEYGRLVIEQTDSALTFTQGPSTPLLVYTDWRETRIAGRYGPGDVTFVTGSWHGTRFEVRRVLPSRTVLVESYEVSNDGTRLTVTTRIAEKSEERGEILPREGRRIYNRATTSQ